MGDGNIFYNNFSVSPASAILTKNVSQDKILNSKINNMEIKTQEETEYVTALIHGEKGWFIGAYPLKYLKQLKFPREHQGSLGASIGQILDKSEIDKLSKEELNTLTISLATYVANSKSFQIMQQTGARTIVITSFRTKREGEEGYVTRVAGLMPFDFYNLQRNDSSFSFTDANACYILLDCLSETIKLYTEEYAPDSKFHDLKRLLNGFYGTNNIGYCVNPLLN